MYLFFIISKILKMFKESFSKYQFSPKEHLKLPMINYCNEVAPLVCLCLLRARFIGLVKKRNNVIYKNIFILTFQQ